jgi:hypothetical protein
MENFILVYHLNILWAATWGVLKLTCRDRLLGDVLDTDSAEFVKCNCVELTGSAEFVKYICVALTGSAEFAEYNCVVLTGSAQFAEYNSVALTGSAEFL